MITLSVVVFNNKFHSDRIHSRPDCLSSTLFIDIFFRCFVLIFMPAFSTESLFRSAGQKNEIINLLKSQFGFRCFFALLNLQLMPMVNVITFMLEKPRTIMLYHYDALLTGLP